MDPQACGKTIQRTKELFYLHWLPVASGTWYSCCFNWVCVKHCYAVGRIYLEFSKDVCWWYFFHLCERPQSYRKQTDLASTLRWEESILLLLLLMALSFSWQYTSTYHSPFLVPLSVWHVDTYRCMLIHTCRDNIWWTEELSISTNKTQFTMAFFIDVTVIHN